MKTLSREASEYNKERMISRMIMDNQELTSQLLGTENKCNVLEKQLEYMRNVVKYTKMERTSVLAKQTL